MKNMFIVGLIEGSNKQELLEAYKRAEKQIGKAKGAE